MMSILLRCLSSILNKTLQAGDGHAILAQTRRGRLSRHDQPAIHIDRLPGDIGGIGGC